MARRAWGEGSTFFDNTKKVWTWRGSYLVNGVKRTRSFTAERQIDLQAKVDKFKNSIKEGTFSDKNITVGKWIDTWLETFIKPSVRVKSYEAYANRLSYLKSVIGYYKLSHITPYMLQDAFLQLALKGGVRGEGLSNVSVNAIRRYFKSCCQSAIRNKLLSDNPVETTKPLKVEPKEKIAISESEVVKLLQVAKEGEYIYKGLKKPNNYRKNKGTEYYIRAFYNLVSFALATGARIGEVRGLTWNCLNLRKHTVTFKQQIVQTDSNEALLEPYLKTSKSHRTIKLDYKICQSLKEFKNFQKEYAEMLGDKFINEMDLVFTNTFGGPISLINFRRRYFSKMLAEAGITDNFTLHSMRHTHATLLLKNGVNVKVVSERLGHSSVIVTMNVYAHVLESMEETAPNVWAELIKDK